VIVVALRTEALALSGHVDGAPLLRTGMGPRRVRRHSALLQAAPGWCSAGVAGGLAPGLSTGEVLVADEITSAHGRVVIPDATVLAERLSRVGLSVRVGRLACSESVVHSAGRTQLAGGGALAVDMESWPLAELAGTRPFAVVRVVLDTTQRPLLRPGTPLRAWRALRTLRRAGPVLGQWALAAGTTTPEEVA
jgi:4-hydroxy-3-methylbut-2-en-1-yl diphosphate reductase